jgi:hypothetical protein
MRYGERQPDCDGRIHRIAAIHKHAAAYVGGQRLLRHHHRMLSANWIFSARGRCESSQRE